MPSWITDVLAAVQPWWPFVVKLLTFWFVGQNMKKRVFTKVRASRSNTIANLRATMWLHPTLGGIVWGLLYPWMPSLPFVTTRGGAVEEGIAAGVLSVVLFMGLERLAEAKGWTWLLKTLRDVGSDRPTLDPPSGPPSDPPPPVPA